MKAGILLLLVGCLSTPTLSALPVTVSARLLDEAGNPLPGVHADLGPLVDSYRRGRVDLGLEVPPAVAAEARSDAEGELTLAAPETGLYRLRFSAPGRLAVETELLPLTEPADLGFVVLPVAEELEVRVEGPGGEGIPGVRLEVTSAALPARQERPDLDLAPRRATTGEDGRARLPRRPGERIEVRAVGSNGRVAEGKAGAGPLVLRLASGSPWSAVLKDSEGKPAAGVLVRLGGTALGVSEVTGRIVLELPNGRAAERLSFEADRGRYRAPAGGSHGEMAFLRRELEGVSPPAPHTLPAVFELRGRVTAAATGKPLAAAWVWDPWNPGAHVRSDAEGRFVLAARSSATGRFAVAAGAPGFAPAEVGAGSEHGPFELSLAVPGTVRGRVVDPTGKGAGGAEVWIEPAAAVEELFPQRFTRSGSDGTFRLSAVSPRVAGSLGARLLAVGSARIEVAALEPGTTRSGLELVLELPRSAFGRVVDRAGEPVTGAIVRLEPALDTTAGLFSYDPTAEGRTRQTESQATGRFTFPSVEEGRYDLRVTAEGKVDMVVRGLEVAPGATPVDLGTVRLDATLALVGRVVDGAGEPVAGAELRSWPERGGPAFAFRRRGESEPHLSGPEGRFEIPNLDPAKTYALRATRAGFAPLDLAGVRVPGLEPLVLTLLPGARVAGRVTDQDGRPVAAAEVELEGSERARLRVLRDDPAPSTRTDAEGGFELVDLPSGSFHVTVTATGFVASEPRGVELAAGASVTDLTIVLAPGATLVGRVTGPDGSSQAGARVLLRSEQQSPFERRSGPGATTDRDGRYELQGVSPGERTFVAEAEGLVAATRTLKVDAGRNHLDFELPAGFEISGRVIGPTGEPVAVGEVEVGPDQPGLFGGDYRPLEGDGSFHFRGLRAGDYRVRALTGVGNVTTTVTVGPGSVVGLVLQPKAGAVIRGRVTGLDFDALSVGRVTIMNAKGEFHPGTLDFKGSYRIENVAPGSWRLMVSAGERRQMKLVEIVEGQSELTVDVAFDEGRTLAVRVLRGGKPVAGVLVFAGARSASTVLAQTDSEGRTLVKGIPEGTEPVVLHVFDGQLGLSHDEQVTPGDQEIAIEIGGRTVAGRVATSDGEPLPGALVTLAMAGEGANVPLAPSLGLTAHSTDSGGFRFPEVPARRYRALATKDGYAQAEVFVDAEKDSVTDVELRLAPARGVTLLLSTPTGPLPPETRVSVVGKGSEGRPSFGHAGQPDERGRLRLESLPRGPWILLVRSPASAVARVTATSPGPPVAVLLEPGAQIEIDVPAFREERWTAFTLLDAAGQTVESLDPWGAGTIVERRLEFGRAEVTGLAAGTYSVTIDRDGEAPLVGRVTVPTGGRARLVLE